MDSTSSGSSSQAPKLIREESPSTPPQVHLQGDSKQPEAYDTPGEIKIQSNEEVRDKDKLIQHLVDVTNDLVLENARLKIEVAKYQQTVRPKDKPTDQELISLNYDLTSEVALLGVQIASYKEILARLFENTKVNIVVDHEGNVLDAVMTDSDEDEDEDKDVDVDVDSDDFEEQMEEAMRRSTVEEVGSSSKISYQLADEGCSSSRTVLPTDPTADGSEIVKQSGCETKIIQRKRKWDVRWETEVDMLCSLSENSEMLLEAVCALYRQEKIMRQRSKGVIRIRDSEFEMYVSCS